MATFADLGSDVLTELGMLALGETADPNELENLRKHANRMLDSWRTERLMVYDIQEAIYLLPANIQNPTIGGTGTFITARPVKIENANTISLASTAITGTTATTGAGNLVLTDAAKDFTALGVIADRDLVYIISGTGVTAGIYKIATVGTTTLTLTTNPGSSGSAISYRVITNPYRYPITPWATERGWATLATRGYASIPTDLYYEPSYPNGTIHLYPYSSTALGLELYMWKPFLEFATVLDTVSFPPGYQDALMYNLCLRATPNGGNLSPLTADMARTSKAKIKSLNAPIPFISTRDSGMPTIDEYWPYR